MWGTFGGLAVSRAGLRVRGVPGPRVRVCPGGSAGPRARMHPNAFFWIPFFWISFFWILMHPNEFKLIQMNPNGS